MPRILIVGGGVSGQKLAEELTKNKLDVQVTLLMASEFSEWAIAMPHVLCHPELHHKAIAANPAKYQIPNVEYKHGVAAGLDVAKKELTLLTSEVLSYDKLVVSTGFLLPVILPRLGCTLEARTHEVQMVGAAIRAAGHVLIGGGGPVALDMAGSVKAAFPDKRVTLVCTSLLAQWPPADRILVETQLEKMGIAVHKAPERCPTEPLFEACTISGLGGDLYLPCFSTGPSTKFLESGNLLDGTGRVKVDKHLRSMACEDLFAVGCSDVPGFTSLVKLEGQWLTVTKNIGAQLKGLPLAEYKESMPQMVRPPVILLGIGKKGWAFVDFKQLPTPLQVCCCNGKCGFPCCPPPCCWCCCPCLCGYCGAPPHGSGVPKLVEKVQFKAGGKNLKGLGEGAPAQEKMK